MILENSNIILEIAQDGTLILKNMTPEKKKKKIKKKKLSP